MQNYFFFHYRLQRALVLTATALPTNSSITISASVCVDLIHVVKKTTKETQIHASVNARLVSDAQEDRYLTRTSVNAFAHLIGLHATHGNDMMERDRADAFVNLN